MSGDYKLSTDSLIRRQTVHGSQHCFEQCFELNALRRVLDGREYKFLELLKDEFGVGIKWSEDLKDPANNYDRLRIKAWSDFSEVYKPIIKLK
jgi:hypothetical protein